MRGPSAGLCGRCRHAREIRNRRGSSFLLCRRSASDPRFQRYPVLPVASCIGFQPAEVGSGGEAEC